jgi:hypothetical protein
MEFFCHYCHDWFETTSCAAHFESDHAQSDVTFEKLKKRWALVGGLETRDESEADLSSEEDRPVFVTNNFRHVL